jgi:hypothetical protein
MTAAGDLERAGDFFEAAGFLTTSAQDLILGVAALP